MTVNKIWKNKKYIEIIIGLILLLFVTVHADLVKKTSEVELLPEVQNIMNNYIKELDYELPENAYSDLISFGLLDSDYRMDGRNRLYNLLKDKKQAILTKDFSVIEKYHNCKMLGISKKYLGECDSEPKSFKHVELPNGVNEILYKYNLIRYKADSAENLSYWSSIIENKDKILPILEKNKILIDRYRALIKKDQFFSYPSAEMLSITRYFSAPDIYQLHKLYLIQVLYDFLANKNYELFKQSILNSFYFYSLWADDAKSSSELFPISLHRMNDHLLLISYMKIKNYLGHNELKELANSEVFDSTRRTIMSSYTRLLKKKFIYSLFDYLFFESFYNKRWDLKVIFSNNDINNLYSFIDCKINILLEDITIYNFKDANEVNNIIDDLNRRSEEKCSLFLKIFTDDNREAIADTSTSFNQRMILDIVTFVNNIIFVKVK